MLKSIEVYKDIIDRGYLEEYIYRMARKYNLEIVKGKTRYKQFETLKIKGLKISNILKNANIEDIKFQKIKKQNINGIKIYGYQIRIKNKVYKLFNFAGDGKVLQNYFFNFKKYDGIKGIESFIDKQFCYYKGEIK